MRRTYAQNREFEKRRRLQQRQRHKAVILLVKRRKNDRAARAARVFVHFSSALVKTTTQTDQFSRFDDNVEKQQ